MKKIVSTASLAAFLAFSAACSETNPTEPDHSIDPPAGMIVSNALTISPSSGVSTGSGSSVAYVSALPGTFQGATSVSVANTKKPAAAKMASVVDGGFDPISVEAQNGDELSVAVSIAGSETIAVKAKVPASHPPRIVRMIPAKGRADVAVNSNLVVVFSEPMELPNATQSPLTLTYAGLPVKGSAKLSDDLLTARFIPDNPLYPQSTYALTLGSGIRDLDGEAVGETATVSFTTSGPVPAGAIEIAISTLGPDQDANGYLLSLQLPARHQSARLAATSTHTFTGVEQGDASVSLYDLAPNCSVTGPNPRKVKVEVGVMARIDYVLACVASGSLRVTTETTGEDPDLLGYGMREIDRSGIGFGHSFTSGFDLGLPPNGTVTAASLSPGTYTVAVSFVAPNCTPAISAIRTITIVAGAETSFHFPVTCAAATQIAFVRGAGRAGSDTVNTDIYIANSNGTGTTRRLTSQPGADLNPAWSPDGNSIAFASDRAGNREIYLMNADGSDPVRLTDHPAHDYQPAYSPDGKRIAFVSRRAGNAAIHVMNADGTNLVRVTTGAADESEPAWSPTGDRIAFSRTGDIYIVPVGGTGETRLTSSAVNTQPAWSPDGSTIAFLSTGRDTYPAVYLMNPDGSQVRRILGQGYFPSSPAWSPDGRTVAFDDWDCWDYGPCPRGIIIGTVGGLYSDSIDDASEPAWSRR